MTERRPWRSETKATTAESAAAGPAAAPDRDSATVWCEKRACRAVVSTVRRDVGGKVLHYVQWCSLVGIEVTCDERCIFSFGDDNEPDRPARR
jgi:hypothetical protein